MHRNVRRSLVLITITLLAACGGGSNSNSPLPLGALSGTVAVGAPMLSAKVDIYDADGLLVGATTTDASGKYSLTGINLSNFKTPFVIKAVGLVGDSTTTLFAVAASDGTVNINQATNAIATTLAQSGDPTSLINGNSLTGTTVSATTAAFDASLSALKAGFNYVGSVLTGNFTQALDGMLDNLSISIKPSGDIDLLTGGTKSYADLIGPQSAFNLSSATSFTSVSLVHGTSPSAADAATLTSPTEKLTVNDLESLRAKLERCFANSPSTQTMATSSGTGVTWNLPTECSDLRLASGNANDSANSGAASNNFLHNGSYWLDTQSYCSTSGSAYCLGVLGAMLTTPKYDKLKFLTPTNITPAGTDGGGRPLWYVKFPIQFDADKSIGQLGDITAGNYMIVTKQTDPDATVKYRFYGNQRHANSYAEPVVQYIKNINTGAYRYETGLNVFVQPFSIRSKRNGANKIWVTKALVKGRGLPVGGISLYNKTYMAPTAATGVSSSGNYRNMCGSSMNLEYSTAQGLNEAVTPITYISGNTATGTTIQNGCAGVIRLAVDATPSAYAPASNVPSYITGWSGSSYLSDSDINAIKVGEPYEFTMTYSDGTSEVYVNRISAPAVNMADAKKISYPAITNSNFGSYNGSQTSNYTLNWNALDTSQIFSIAMYWNKGTISTSINNIQPGATSYDINCGALSTSGCTTNSYWDSNNDGTPDSGILQVRSRTFSGLQIFAQQRQY